MSVFAFINDFKLWRLKHEATYFLSRGYAKHQIASSFSSARLPKEERGGAFALAKGLLEADPLSGHLFGFCNKGRTRLKLLYWDGSGLWVCANSHDALISQLTAFNNFSTAHTRFLKESGIAHFTRHDLRRTMASGWQRLGVPVSVTEVALAHRSGSLAGVIGIYQRYDYFNEVKDALNKWQRHLETLR